MPTLLLSLLFGCGGSEPASAPPEPTPAPAPAEDPFTSKMRLHYELATKARSSVIKGDLAAAQEAARELGEMEEPDVPEPWKPHLLEMKVHARLLASTSDLVQAGEAVAKLGQTCGDCHAMTGGGPKADAKAALESKEAPPENHMRRHLYCADRMWLGIVAPNHELFSSGASILAATELHHAVSDGTPVPEDFSTLEKQIHELAEIVSKSNDRAEEAKLYGHFLGNCATCHQAVGVEPQID